VQIDVRGASMDLHSGTYGGAVANPIHALVHVLDTMHAPDGAIAVSGFYDTVRPLTKEERAVIAAVPQDEGEFMRDVGVDALVGEPGYSLFERLWARPTLEVNGIWGGFQGAGTKTVLPNEAHAKITCRLVPDQDPAAIAALVVQHAERHAPPGVRVAARQLPGSARPYLVPADHWGNRAVAGVLRELYGREPYQTRSGGSVPVRELFQTHLGAATVGFGFQIDDERFHAPDEFWRLASFERALRGYCLLLHRLAQATPA
jgi:acetylornithine deacetylase/succinyl-diaminopimelate desuccinylase-like protein